MTMEERVEAMEQLWDSISREDVSLASPAWHEPILGERARLADSDEATWLGLDELQARLMSR